MEKDPCRLTNMDTYSNILYVTEAHAKLSYLAYKASITDKYTPESCAIIGTFLSLYFLFMNWTKLAQEITTVLKETDPGPSHTLIVR